MYIQDVGGLHVIAISNQFAMKMIGHLASQPTVNMIGYLASVAT